MRSLVAIVLMLAFQFGAPPQPASGIAGQFLLDGQPASGVPIMVMRQDGGGPAGGVAGVATTDATGNYQVAVPPGSYYVRTGNTPITYYPGAPVIEAATVVVVESGKVKRGVTFGDSSTRRRPSSSIFSPTPPNALGQVLPQRSGVITGTYMVAGQPAANVRIGALPAVTNGPFVQVVSQGVTDSAGNFRLERLPAGAYHVRTLEGTVYYPGVAGSVGAVAVVVEDNKVTEGINFQSARPPAPVAPSALSAVPGAPGRGALTPGPGNSLPSTTPLISGIPGGVVAPMGNQPVPARQKAPVLTYAGIGPPYEDGAPGVQTSGNLLEAPSWILPDGAGGFFVSATNAVFQISSNGRMERVAGSLAAAGFRGDGAPAQSAQLRSPRGLARDAAGNLYIADAGNHRIRMVNRGVISTIAGNGTAGFSGDGGPAVSASLNNPSGIAVDTQGNLYIADTGNHRIRRVTPQGTISTLAGTGKEGLNGDGGPAVLAWLTNPMGIAVDQEKNVFFADTDNHAIRMITAKGVIWTVAGTATPGFDGDAGPATLAHIRLPQGVAVDENGVLTIADGGNRTIRTVTGGKPWSSFGPANATKPRIATLAALPAKVSGSSAPARGSASPSPNTRSAFMAVALERSGSVLVAGDDLVYRLSSRGALAVVAGVTGTPAEQPNGDAGPATAARLRAPGALAVDPNGNLFIAERMSQPGDRTAWVRKVTPEGIISTVASGSFSVAALAADREGNVYIGAEGAILKVEPGGKPALFAGSLSPVASGTPPAGQFGYIRALAFDLDGNLLVAESNHRVSKIDRRSGAITVFAGGGRETGNDIPAVSAQVSDPSALAVDRLGNVYIAENGNGRIRKVNAQGIISLFAGTGPSVAKSSEDGRPAVQAPLILPKHLAVDTAGNVYLAEGTSSSYLRDLRVRKVGADGILVTVFGPTVQLKGVTGDLSPSGLATDAAGNLFVADQTTSRVYKIAPER